MWMPVRSLAPEYLDDHQPDQQTMDRIYRFLSLVNLRLGGTRATLARFEVLSRSWTPRRRINVLDVATGAADVPRALIAWGRERGFDIHVTALDLSLGALTSARRAGSPDDRLRFICADVDHLPFPDHAFDYVTCALFFHHLTDARIVSTLAAFDRVAARGIVVNDLVRRWRAYFWIRVFTLPVHPILRNDGPLSVQKALRPDELQGLVERAGLAWLTILEHFGHRMTLAGDRPGVDTRRQLRF
jgi:ubiquinone/menaquinone biosynthesis C-methylase UbiE